MSDIQKELNNRIHKCIKGETGLDLTDPSVLSSLSPEDKAEIEGIGFKCGVKVIRGFAKSKFSNWIGEEFEEVGSQMEEVGKRLIRFGAKIGDPAALFRDLYLRAGIHDAIIKDVDGEDLLSDHSAVVRLFLMSNVNELRSRVFINSLRPLLFTIGLAQSALGKDMSWCTCMLALTIEEQLIKKKAKEVGIEVDDGEFYHSILNKLTAYLEELGIRQSREILLADAHRKIRNKVLHKSWNPTEEEMDDIIAHVLKITQFFSSEVFR